MRQARKILGLVVVATLLAAACGDNAENTTDTVSTDSAPADTTADDDNRDRNVGTSGFGENGGGVASARLTENVETRFDTRVFRRVRYEEVGGRRVANFRDLFVVTKVRRTVSDKVSTTLHIDGFTTEGDDTASYPMRNFGDAGRVSIEMPVKSSEWVNIPNAFTVVSRELLAVSFPTAEIDGDSAGLIEFYDLPSGRPNTTLGDKGRIVVPKSTGIDDVYDIALREMGDDGKPRLVVAGLAYDTSNDSYTETDLVIAGFTADGKPDTEVGAGGSGTISLRGSLASFGTNALWNVRLADPGLSTVKGMIGAAVTSLIPNPTKIKAWRPDEVELTGLVARAPRSGGPITMDAANGAYVNSLRTGLESVGVRNAILDIDNSLDVHMTGVPYGTGYTPQNEHGHDAVTFTSASPTQGVTVRPINVPFRTANKAMSRTGAFVADLSSEGKRFSVEIYNDTAERVTSSVICFDEQLCNVDDVPGVRALIDISPAEGSWTTVQSMQVDAAGVHVVVHTARTLLGDAPYQVLSFAPDGSAVVGEPSTFGGDFNTYESEEIEENNVLNTFNVRWVDAANVLGARRLATTGSTRRDYEPNMVLVSDAGEDPREVPLSLPLGISSYSADKQSVARVDDSSLALRADVFSDSGREVRLYKVNVDNGSVDVGFGTNGHATVSGIRRDDDCRWDEVLESGPGVVALLVIDHDPKSVDDAEDCSEAPHTVSWAAFTTLGKAVGTGTAVADLVPVGFTGVTDYSVDARGNLYVVGYRDVFDGEDYVTSSAVIAKFTLAGAPDATFGTNGVATFDGTTNALYSAGVQLVGAVDAEARVYLAAPISDYKADVDVLVLRLTAAGVVDGAMGAVAPDAAEQTKGDATPRQERETAQAQRESNGAAEAAAKTADERQAATPIDSGLTVIATKPVLTAVKAVVDRSLTVWWSQPAAKQGYVTAIAMPGGRTCTSNEGSCIIRGLDPSVAYTVTVAPKGEEAAGSASAESISLKPIVTLKLGRVASPTTYVRPASRGKATWKVRGGCTLNESNTRITAPRRATKCQLSVTTAKFESTPKTTKSVTIVVTK